jgi:hypothetical protein
VRLSKAQFPNVRWAALGGGYGGTHGPDLLHPSTPASPFLQLFILYLFLMAGPTDTVPPPSYQMSLQEFDQKTTRTVQLSSSTTVLVDEDGWPIYDAAAFEAVAGSSDRPPPASTSAGIVGTDTHRNERRGRQSFEKVPTSPRSMKKVRSCLSYSGSIPLIPLIFPIYRPDHQNAAGVIPALTTNTLLSIAP